MLMDKTICIVADNSGVKKFRVFKVLGRGPKKAARIAGIVIGSAIEVIPESPIKKKSVLKGIIVRTKAPIKRKNGTTVRFDDNAVVILGADEGTIRATRIIGPVAREIRSKGYKKIISLAKEII
ncbi:50S ribosomal protein L14 [Candidatus Berkelbacteria bacterium CG_4_9_14_3_um_filter_39_23]|uniref:Large ribosomal subunit protein uL14 n=2 Tax=Candidatus Berkelbacteria TaxID=1618330 RepID=A0A2M7CJ39_9BACT|nr:50S ribosomal protein L14 [Candidatus Berkelbacteria bacterium]OIP06181.1 MAG: 50S ribosomal protein L14 [Candidatus Berkelbacteria bacterium CG2_30_39_44]PIR28095.1 MAG: 50S ribosomal protein L14 [Candidatus Berkelbacteria bacterium CG11_big_fil_rev_8_21_14_0_20_40_23]PIV25671.1 MAG: 50S ribosomal protein L14 [Candidatus Berkelbacteria bacterium CG03_land_8_20_14_0_80_40_36]PIX30723.1 MAG: 50S ribosomal protein L14 [Candidatus Berkelbacteria bacterium CG_4_8_14_3_um_filter_39_27]PIZ28891.1